MKNKKNIFILIILILITISISACGNNNNNNSNNTNYSKKTPVEIIEDNILSITSTEEITNSDYIIKNTEIIVNKDIIFEDKDIFIEIVDNGQYENTDKYMHLLEKFADAKYDKETSKIISSNEYDIANKDTFALTMLRSDKSNTFKINYKKRININNTSIEKCLNEILLKIKNNFNITLNNNKEYINLTKEIFNNKKYIKWNIIIKDEKDNLNDIEIFIEKPILSDPYINVNYLSN